MFRVEQGELLWSKISAARLNFVMKAKQITKGNFVPSRNFSPKFYRPRIPEISEKNAFGKND